jgi:hypothetical protein
MSAMLKCDQVMMDSRCFRGAFPPVDFRAVCFVRAIVIELGKVGGLSGGRVVVVVVVDEKRRGKGDRILRCYK